MNRLQAVTRDHIVYSNSSFPFQASITDGVNPGFQRLHWHHAHEINYIRSGSGIYLINGVKLEFAQGDIIFINSDDLHRVFESQDLVMEVIMFDPSLLAVDLKFDPDLTRPFRELGVHFPIVVTQDHPINSEMAMLFNRVVAEYLQQDRAHTSLIRADLVRLLCLANRHLDVTDKNGQEFPAMKHRGKLALKEVLRTIETRLEYPWTLQEMADLSHLSQSRFSALFQQTVGTSPLNYLIQLRLSYAVHLIETTDTKIIDIAEQCGFRNLSNFNRLFKQHIGAAPSELRACSSTRIG